ncbi:MAG: hypothetical protein RLZZ450_4730 [Pseudomonadota bacterium]|jgi:uncharacterized membrane protein YedE/YeeE
MRQSLGQQLAALIAGLTFGAGLVVSGMTQPQKVLGFLDPLGRFDASLIFVMVGAIAVHFFAYRWKKGRSAPLFGSTFLVPTRRDIDVKLMLGALIFGAGWGLGGYCPGPGIVSLPGGGVAASMFVAAMITGMLATAKLESYLARKKPSLQPSATTTAAPERIASHTHTVSS